MKFAKVNAFVVLLGVCVTACAGPETEEEPKASDTAALEQDGESSTEEQSARACDPSVQWCSSACYSSQSTCKINKSKMYMLGYSILPGVNENCMWASGCGYFYAYRK